MIRAPGELFSRDVRNPILTALDLPYPVNSVFNPAAVQFGDETLLLLRVEDRRGISHLTIARSHDGVSDWKVEREPVFAPDPNFPEENYGVEDARVTFLDELGVYVMTYTAYSDVGPLVSMATTRDFQTFERLGPVLPPENKDAAVFPVRFNGRWMMIHRPVTGDREHGAHVWLAASPDLVHWSDHRILLRARHGAGWDAHKIGLSPPPLLTDEGWLVLFHGSGGGTRPMYRLGLALLDRDDPSRVIRRGSEWIFGPHTTYECEGDVQNVVFPCGWIRDGDHLRIYYGAADTSVGVAHASLTELLGWLLSAEAVPAGAEDEASV
jgi:predicted GH43/DUF377 family glycosyl hydrolase